MLRAAVACALIVMALAACGGSQLQTTSARVSAPAGKTASFDDIEIDQASQTVYAADRGLSGVDVFDVSGAQPRFVKTISLPAMPNGLAIDHAQGRVYAGTGSGAIEVIDAGKLAVVSEIKTSAKDVDLVDFAPGPGWLLAATGAGGEVLTVDVASGKVIAIARIGKPVEQPRYDPTSGRVYAAVPELNALAVIDPKTGSLIDTLKLGTCIPTGLAIRTSTGTALISCRKSVIVYRLRDGATTDLGPRVAEGDVVQYFPSIDRFLVDSPHSAVPSVVGMFGGDPVSLVSSLNLEGGGNAVVYDERSDTLYTTDERPGTAGLTGFQMDGTKPTSVWQTVAFTVGPLLLFLLVLAPLWWFAGRHADPIHRKSAAPPPKATPAGSA